MLKHRKSAVFGIVGALILLLGDAGFVYAQGPEPPVDGGDSRGWFGGGCPRYRMGRGAFGMGDRWMSHPRAFGTPASGADSGSLVDATAEVTGLAEDEVIAALKDGQTFAEIAEAEGVDPQEIVDAFTAERGAALQEAVDEGRLTKEQMEQMLEETSEHITERLDEPWEPRPFGGRGFRGGLLGLGGGSWTTTFDAVAEALGLTPKDLFAELHDGKGVVEVAEGQGVEMEEIRDAVDAARLELREEVIEQAAKEGRLSEKQADWLLEGFEEGYIPGGRNFSPGRGFRPGYGGHGRGMGR